jgi:signal transduction histidine kinase
MTMEPDTIGEISYRFLCEEAPILFLVFNRKGTILEMNAHARGIFGESEEERTLGDLFLDFRGLLDFAVCAADPSRIHLLGVSSPDCFPHTYRVRFHDLGDRIVALGWQDMHEYDSLQKEILTLNSDLSNLTRDLHQRNAELKKLDDMKNHFIGMASHDLRTPLHHIKAFSKFLLNDAGSFTAEQREYISTIHSSSEYMREIVESFLDFSIIESGKLRLNTAPTGLEPLITRALKLIEERARKKVVTLELRHDKAIPPLFIDGQKIEQVLVNLISNGVDYSRPTTTVRVETKLEKDIVTVSVTDEGEGISADELPRLFSVFGKGKAKKTGNEKSTGLGLVISRKIIEAHGGVLEVTSTVGSGSRFTFSLPLDHVPEESNLRE